MEKQQKKLAAKGIEVDLATLKQDWLKKRESGDYLQDEEIDVVGSDSEDDLDDLDPVVVPDIKDCGDAEHVQEQTRIPLETTTTKITKPPAALAEKRKSSFSIDSLLSSAEGRWLTKS